MESETRAQMIALHSEEELAEWVRENQGSQYSRPKPFKVFRLEPVTVKTEISISFG